MTADTKAMFVVAPVRRPPKETLERLEEFVRKGGHLIVMDNIRSTAASSAGAFMEALGIPLVRHHPGTTHGKKTPHIHASSMERLEVPAQDAFAAVKEHGQGKVIYMAEASDFSRKHLGHCFTVPKRKARDRYETVYFLLRDDLGLAPKDRRFHGIL